MAKEIVNTADELGKLSESINAKIEVQVKSNVKAMIKIGSLLLEARTHFKGDLEFGQWREAKTHLKTQKQAYMCMKLCQAQSENALFTDELMNELPPSTLLVLTSASDEVIEEVSNRIKSGETPTRAEVIESAKELSQGGNSSPQDVYEEVEVESESPFEEPSSKAGATKNGERANSKSVDWWIQLAIVSELEDTMEIIRDDDFPLVDDITVAACILGADADPSYAPLKAPALTVLVERRIEQAGDRVEWVDAVNSAYTTLSAHYRDVSDENLKKENPLDAWSKYKRIRR